MFQVPNIEPMNVHPSRINLAARLQQTSELREHNYLFLVDYYSRDVEIITPGVSKCHSLGKASVTLCYNGPQFSYEELKEFAVQLDFELVTPSPPYAQSNGEV